MVNSRLSPKKAPLVTNGHVICGHIVAFHLLPICAASTNQPDAIVVSVSRLQYFQPNWTDLGFQIAYIYISRVHFVSRFLWAVSYHALVYEVAVQYLFIQVVL